MKFHRIILFMFAMVPLHLLFLTLGHIAHFSNFLFVSDVLRDVFHFLYFPVFSLIICNDFMG